MKYTLPLSLLVLGACVVPPAQGPPPTGPAPAGPPPAAAPPAASPGTAAAGPSGGVAASADCPNPADHCLPGGDYWAFKREWTKQYVWAEVATQQSPPDGAGEARFFLRRSGKELSTKWFHQSQAATPAELAVGQLVIMFHDNKKDRIYRAPLTRKDALGKRWWMARISSIDPIATGGYVLVSGGYKVSTNNLRWPTGSNKESVVVSGSEDAHFLKDHWIVAKGPLKDGNYDWVELSAAITAPSAQTKNEGHFIFLRSGEQMWSGHAWRTRPATQEDLKLGARVFMFHDNKKNKVYQKPSDRAAAIGKRWWSAKVTDNSTAYKGIVTVAGSYQVAVDNLRVPL